MLSSFRGILYCKPIALALFAGLVALTSCIPQKKMLLMQYDKLIDSTYAKSFNGTDFEDSIYHILPNDYLYINITTVEKPISQFIEPSAGLNYLNDGNQALVGYHVADDGRIYFPYVGFIPMAGLTMSQARDTLKSSISHLLGRCRVDVVLINNTVYMMGEFAKQGAFNMTRNKLSIYEAVVLAGGLNDYARRDFIKVLRTEGNERKMYIVDLRSGNLIGKNMFYVYPNDLIYAEPMKAKAMGLTPTFSLGIISTILTLAVLLRTMLI